LLHRAADESAESYWTTLLDGGLSREQFAVAILLSDEFQSADG
jgi:hypothetical protein